MFSLSTRNKELGPERMLTANILFVTLLFFALSVDVDPSESRSLAFLTVDEVDPLESPEDDEST